MARPADDTLVSSLAVVANLGLVRAQPELMSRLRNSMPLAGDGGRQIAEREGLVSRFRASGMPKDFGNRTAARTDTLDADWSPRAVLAPAAASTLALGEIRIGRPVSKGSELIAPEPGFTGLGHSTAAASEPSTATATEWTGRDEFPLLRVPHRSTAVASPELGFAFATEAIARNVPAPGVRGHDGTEVQPSRLGLPDQWTRRPWRSDLPLHVVARGVAAAGSAARPGSTEPQAQAAMSIVVIDRAPSLAAAPEGPPVPAMIPGSTPAMPGGVAPDASAHAPPQSAGPDLDELGEQVWRAVMSRLAIEQERRGFGRWS
jgi:hypothetical protein